MPFGIATVNDFCPLGEILGLQPEHATIPNSICSKFAIVDCAKAVADKPLDLIKYALTSGSVAVVKFDPKFNVRVLLLFKVTLTLPDTSYAPTVLLPKFVAFVVHWAK